MTKVVVWLGDTKCDKRKASNQPLASIGDNDFNIRRLYCSASLVNFSVISFCAAVTGGRGSDVDSPGPSTGTGTHDGKVFYGLQGSASRGVGAEPCAPEEGLGSVGKVSGLLLPFLVPLGKILGFLILNVGLNTKPSGVDRINHLWASSRNKS